MSGGVRGRSLKSLVSADVCAEVRGCLPGGGTAHQRNTEPGDLHRPPPRCHPSAGVAQGDAEFRDRDPVVLDVAVECGRAAIRRRASFVIVQR